MLRLKRQLLPVMIEVLGAVVVQVRDAHVFRMYVTLTEGDIRRQN